MSITANPSKFSVEVKEIVDNFFFRSKHINCFSHSRIFADGSRAELWSDSCALEHTYLKTNYTTVTHAPDLYGKGEKCFFLGDKLQTFSTKVKENYAIHMGEQREFFNHDNTFIIRGHDELCDEFFCFYGPKGDYTTKIFFTSNIPLLNAFTKEFKHKAQHMIKQAEESRIVTPQIIVKTKDYQYLTIREKQVAQQLTYYKTAKEIASTLGIKKRTAEGVISRIKDKYLCDKKKELINLLRQNPYLFSS